MISIKNIALYFLGKDPWAEAIHQNKNTVTAQALKTQVKVIRLNKVLGYKKDNVYWFARAMNTIRVGGFS